MANETASAEPSSEVRFNSWKEIAAYLKCSERTVRRWEEEGLPVHRHPHKARAAIYAYKAEIDAWWGDGHEPPKQIQDPQEHPPAVAIRWWTRLSRAMLGAALAFALASVVFLVGFGRRFHWFQPGALNGQIHSIAVLPLENLSGDPQQEYVADGMTDELITELAQLKELRVISRASVMRFKGAKTPLPQIARELQVDTIVEGSVAHLGTRVRVSAQLLDATTDRHLWAETYERDLSDVLSLQRDLAKAIAGEIRIKLSPNESARLEGSRAINPLAHAAFLRGRYFTHNQRSPEGARKSIQSSLEAVRIAPDWAPAYSGLADSYIQAAFLAALPPNEAMPRAKVAARRALELDLDLSEAHVALGWILSNFDYEYSASESEFKRAIELSPSSSYAHQGYADLLNGLGRHDEAISEIKVARQLDPVSFFISRDVGRILYDARRYDEALEALRQAADLSPASGVVYNWMSWVYDKKGMAAQSVEMDLKNAVNRGASQEVLQQLKEAYRVSGERGYLKKHAQLIKDDPYEQALYTARLGETEKALQLLRQACEEHSGWLDMLKVDPELDNLRPDRRFGELLYRINLSPSI